MILETEMVRLRAPMLVRDVQNDPRTHRPIADASFSRSYVTAPLMPEGRVIGFIHADCYMTRGTSTSSTATCCGCSPRGRATRSSAPCCSSACATCASASVT